MFLKWQLRSKSAHVICDPACEITEFSLITLKCLNFLIFGAGSVSG